MVHLIIDNIVDALLVISNRRIGMNQVCEQVRISHHPLFQIFKQMLR